MLYHYFRVFMFAFICFILESKSCGGALSHPTQNLISLCSINNMTKLDLKM